MVRKLLKVSYDILRGVNATLWGGKDGAEKVTKIIKTGASLADVVLGTSLALEDLACGDKVCATLDVIGCVSSALGLVVGNVPIVKNGTIVTGGITVACRYIRWHCKNYGSFWGCAIVVTEGASAVVQKIRVSIPEEAVKKAVKKAAEKAAEKVL